MRVNYRASKRGCSGKRYLAKLGIAEEEADEPCYWLELISEANWGLKEEANPLLREANERTAILVYLIKKGKSTS